LAKLGWRVWIGFIWLWIGTGSGLLWTWWWNLGFQRRREIFLLSYYQLLKNPAEWSMP
jgi:hypothetical protein